MQDSGPRLRRSSLVTIASAVALAAFSMAPAAHAQYSSTFALSVFGGYNVASDIFDDVNGRASLEIKNDFMWGGRATVFTNEYSAIEFAYSRVEADLELKYSPLTLPPDFRSGSMAVDEYDLNFLVSQPTPNPRVWPYFTLGLGWSVTHPSVDAQDPISSQPIEAEGNSLFAFNFGIGTLVEMNPKLALRLDARWRVTDTNITTDSGVYCDYYGYCWGYSSDWYNSGEFTAGLTFRLGNN